MPNAYLSLDEFKATSNAMGLGMSGTAGDARLLGLLEGLSRQADRYVNGHFFTEVGTKFFNGNGRAQLVTPNLISVATLAESDNYDGTFDSVWSSTDYYLGPFNANPTSEYGRPYTYVEVNYHSNGTQSAFTRGQRNFLISGTWGYVSVTSSLGATLAGSINATQTTVDFGTSMTLGSGRIGWTVAIGTEQMYVTGESGNTLTVQRGVNGAAASTHGSGAAASRYVYPPAVTQAVAIQAGRMFKRAQGQYASNIGNPEAGEFIEVRQGMDRDVQQLLQPYRRLALGGL